jgi:hypothetical protein
MPQALGGGFNGDSTTFSELPPQPVQHLLLSSSSSFSPALLVAVLTHRRPNSFAATSWSFPTTSALRALRAVKAVCTMTSRSSVFLQTAVIRWDLTRARDAVELGIA